MDKLTRKLTEDMTPERKQQSREIKARAKARLLQTHSPDVVAKALGRAERWMKAAYGEADYVSQAGESGEDCIGNFYAGEIEDEIAAGGTTGATDTANRSQFGARSRNRY